MTSEGGDDTNFDHGDWANARLVPLAAPSPAATADAGTAADSRAGGADRDAAQFDYNHAPHALVFSFSADVSSSISRDDLRLEHLTKSFTIPTSAIAVTYDKAANTATFTFPGLRNGRLPDGRYRATLVADGIRDSAGTALASDISFDVFFLVGDANRDGAVNRADFDILKASYRQRGRLFSQGDFNYDGVVNKADFNLLARRYGISVLGTSQNLRAKRLKNVIEQLNKELSEKTKREDAQRKAQKQHDDEDENYQGKKHDDHGKDKHKAKKAKKAKRK